MSTPLLPLARAVFDRLQAAFESAVAHTAARCARNGKLDADLLDINQWVCYELALANADLFAARISLSLGANISVLDAGLALAFAAAVAPALVERLEGHVQCRGGGHSGADRPLF